MPKDCDFCCCCCCYPVKLQISHLTFSYLLWLISEFLVQVVKFSAMEYNKKTKTNKKKRKTFNKLKLFSYVFVLQIFHFFHFLFFCFSAPKCFLTNVWTKKFSVFLILLHFSLRFCFPVFNFSSLPPFLLHILHSQARKRILKWSGKGTGAQLLIATYPVLNQWKWLNYGEWKVYYFFTLPNA